AERDTIDPIRIAAQRQRLVARLPIPDLGRLVAAAGHQSATIGTEGQALHAIRVAAERIAQCRALRLREVPDANVPIGAGSREPTAVRTEDARGHRSGVLLERAGM